MTGSGKSRERIVDVVRAEHRPAHFATRHTRLEHGECRTIAARRQLSAPQCTAGAACSEPFVSAPAAQLQYALQIFIACVHDESAARWNRAHQMMKLALNGRKVRIDVGVVEFEIIEDRGARSVMHELGPLVEEGGVVLVGLNHEERLLTEPGTDRKIDGHAADQEAGREPCILQNPGQHAGGGGLAVSAGHSQHPALAKHIARQPLGARGVRNAGLQQGLNDRHASTHDIADHHLVGSRRELGWVVTLDQFNAQRLELRAHGRIDVAV